MNDNYNKLQIEEMPSNYGNKGPNNKSFNAIVIVLIILVFGAFALFKFGALSVSDLIKTDQDETMVFNTTTTGDSTTTTITPISTGINGTTVGTTTVTRITTTTTTVQLVGNETVKNFYYKLNDTGWDCTPASLTCTKIEKDGERTYYLTYDLINLNMKLSNIEDSSDTYAYYYDFRTKKVTGTFNNRTLNYDSNTSFFAYYDDGSKVDGLGATIIRKAETFALFYINSNDFQINSLIE